MVLSIGTIVFLFGLIFALVVCAYAYLFIFNKKDGVCDVLEERDDGNLIVLKSNVPYRFKGRTPGKPDSMKIGKYKECKPIERIYALPWLAKRTDKLYILRDKDGFFHPMKPYWDAKEKELKLKPDYRETIDWLVNEFDEKDKIKEKVGTLEKFMPQIVLGIVFLFAFMSMFYNWQHEKEMLNKMDGVKIEFDNAVITAKSTYDPTIVRKAAEVVARYNMERGTTNWTQTTIQTSGGIQVSS